MINIGHVRKLSEADKNLRILQEKNSKIIEFAKPLAQKLQETQEEFELTVQKCGDLKLEILSAHNYGKQSDNKCSDLEEQLSILQDSNNAISKQCNELTNEKLDFESIINEHSLENTSLMSKLKEYEDIIEDFDQQLAETTRTVETLRAEQVVKECKIDELSRNEEAFIQSKHIISNLENKIEKLTRDSHNLQQNNSDQRFKQEISSLNEKLLQTQSENLYLCNEINAQSYLLQDEVNDNNDLKLKLCNLKEEVSAISSLKTLDGSSQTLISQDNLDLSAIFYQDEIKTQEISNLMQKIITLESENEHLFNKNESLLSIESKMAQLNQENDELKQQVNKIQLSQSYRNKLDIVNIKSNQMSAQLKMVQTISQSSDTLHLGPDSANIQSALTELLDQLSVSNAALTISMSNEKQLHLDLTRLEENYKALLTEKSNIVGKLGESEKRINELTHDLNITKSSFQNKLQSAHQHINELQSIFLSNRKVSPSIQKNKISKSIADSETLFTDQNISNYSLKTVIPRSSSTPCITEELSPIYDRELELHPNNLNESISEQLHRPGIYTNC